MPVLTASVRFARVRSPRPDTVGTMNNPPTSPARSGAGGALALLLTLVVIAAVFVWVLMVTSAAGSAPEGARSSVAPPPMAAAPQAEPADGDAAADVAPGAAAAGLVPDPNWVEHAAAATGIPERAFTAYAAAALTISTTQPGCGLGWNTIAAIGSVESDHGRHAGATLGNDGRSEPAIRGAALDGNGVQAIPDTDGGQWDGDTVWDRAVGPMQFIPTTWEQWGSDGNRDGISDPNQIDDAALAAARYLCASGSVTGPEAWRAAVFSYNNLETYVDEVARRANDYAARAG